MKTLFLAAMMLLTAQFAQSAWKKTVTVGGKTTVTGDAETMAREKEKEEARAAYQKEIAEAPRREAADPIRVTIINPVWDGKNKNENLNRANKMLADEFKNDPILKVALADIPLKTGKDNPSYDYLVSEAAMKGKGAAVYLTTELGTEAALGRRSDGKVVAANAIVFKAEARTPYDPAVGNAKELGNILQTAQMVKDVAKTAGEYIKNELGPKLPSAKAVDAITKKHTQSAWQKSTGIEPGDDTKTQLKKLFKPRNQVN